MNFFFSLCFEVKVSISRNTSVSFEKCMLRDQRRWAYLSYVIKNRRMNITQFRKIYNWGIKYYYWLWWRFLLLLTRKTVLFWNLALNLASFENNAHVMAAIRRHNLRHRRIAGNQIKFLNNTLSSGKVLKRYLNTFNSNIPEERNSNT